MATSTPVSQPNPARIFEALQAFQSTAVMRAAIELEVFTAIAEGCKTAAALAARCSASERGLRILCDFLTVEQFLIKQGDEYSLAPESALFLDRRSPAYLGSASKFLSDPEMVSGFQNLTGAVRKGGTMIGKEGTTSPDNPIWVEFARSMAPLTTGPAESIARLAGAGSGEPMKVLDIAASHGLFGIAIARLNPNASIVAQDWKAVLEVAKENAARAGLTHRFSTLPGSAFDVDFGAGYDLVLLTNFLHHFSPAQNITLLKKVRASLKSTGRAVTLEFMPNDDHVSPPVPAKFSMTMLGSTPEGEAYTFRQFEKMFLTAGFSRCELHPLEQSFQQLVIAYA